MCDRGRDELLQCGRSCPVVDVLPVSERQDPAIWVLDGKNIFPGFFIVAGAVLPALLDGIQADNVEILYIRISDKLNEEL